MSKPRFVVGIDLGTTNTAMAFADAAREASGVRTEVFSVPQLVAAGEVEAAPLLPSARYHPREGEFLPGALDLPWGTDPFGGAVGALALREGARSPERLVTSAKSWLSHGAVDRHAAILPWGAPAGVTKISPVDASASYLAHLRAAWNHAHPSHLLEQQEVVLTIPASFDEAARALTLEASKRAGLPAVKLVEEPQAAFYDWLERHAGNLEAELGGTRLALVVDVGGGTTDLSLIRAEAREAGPRLTRIAVGEHLMLGGDNMDLLLARHLEPVLADGGTLGAQRFGELVHGARTAKEQLLAPDAPPEVKVTVLGGGSRLVGAARTAALSREMLTDLVVDGFFPEVTTEAAPETRRSGVVEFGLPFVRDAAITRHLAEFLRKHAALSREALGDAAEAPTAANPQAVPVPDAVLYNGGVFLGAQLQRRVTDLLSAWRGAPVRVLENPHPDLAVARGAVAFALARRGVGLKIGGGSARTFFLLLGGAPKEAEAPAAKPAVVVLPRGAEEGEELELKERAFSLKLGAPVRFRVAASTSEVQHRRPGDLVDLTAEPHVELPPLAAVLEGTGAAKGTEVPVRLVAALTEIGTLELGCVRADDPGQRWKLEFALRGGAASGALEQIRQLHPRFEEATARIRRVYGKSTDGVLPKETKSLRADLERILGERPTWDTPLLRELFGALLAGQKHRRRSADHERVWLNLTGYCLRPGFGYPLDDFRVGELFRVFADEIQYTPEAQNWAEWWILWRRVAGGLGPEQQAAVLKSIAWYLEPEGPRPRPKPPGPRKLAQDDMVKLAGVLEHIEAGEKERVGELLLRRLAAKDENPQTWWAVGRIGARVPFYGSAHRVVSAEAASRWARAALDAGRTAPWTADDPRAFAAMLLTRASGDRARDVDEGLRDEVRAALTRAKAPAAWASLVASATHLDADAERRVFGESLPPGLRLL